MAIKRKSHTFLLSLTLLLSITLCLATELERRGREEWEGSEEEREERREKENNPLIFNQERLRTLVDNEQGRISVLDRLGRRSDQLRGLRHYNVAVLEARPNSFLLPNHLDADVIFFVANGRGVITLVHRNRRESHNLERGDIFVLPAGTTYYLFNRDNSRNLRVAKLLRSVIRNDRVEPFFGAGGRNPRSFYKAFSREIIEAALNARGERLERVLSEQDEGILVRASEEQIRALIQDSSSERGRGRGGGGDRGESRESEHFNLFERRPSHGNNNGQLYEARLEEPRLLQDLDLGVSFVNISHGSIFGPYYNSRATKFVVVVKGSGHIQIVRPRIESGSHRRGSRYEEERHGWQEREGRGSQERGYEGQEGSIRNERESADVSVGDVFIVPAGHPVVSVASQNRNDRSENLQIVCFEINAENNQRYPLAGEGNVILQLDDKAQELSFNQDSKVVQQVFGNQPRTFFFPGQSQRHYEQGRELEKVLKVAEEKVVNVAKVIM